MRRRNALLSAMLILLLAAVGVGCKKPPATQPAPSEPAKPAPPPPPPVREPEPEWKGEKIEEKQPTIDELIAMGKRELKPVYFAYDSSELSQASLRTLQANYDWLAAHSQLKLVIEGHCDERGTIEYNLALGGSRANTVRDYLAGLGLAMGRMRVISYGEERPAERGQGEAAWVKNRRAEFVPER